MVAAAQESLPQLALRRRGGEEGPQLAAEEGGHGSWRRREVPWGRGSQRPEWLPRLAPRRRGEAGGGAPRLAAEGGLAAKEAGAAARGARRERRAADGKEG